MNYTYRNLIEPIPPTLNLENIEAQPPGQTCVACRKIIPNRQLVKHGRIETNFEVIDEFPVFPLLKLSGKNGCTLCRLLRKTIRSSWGVAVRPMQEVGKGALSSKDRIWDELLRMPWDCKVRIHSAHFAFDSFGSLTSGLMPDEKQSGGMITNLYMEYGPASASVGEDGKPLHGNIVQNMTFSVCDLPGKKYRKKDSRLSTYSWMGGNEDRESEHKEFRRRLPSPSSLSERNISLMGSWIGNCSKFHPHCRIEPLATWLPRRLIQISKSIGSTSLRIIETPCTPQAVHLPIQYLALSHVWGSLNISPPLRTFQSNYEEMKQRINPNDLPQTFADAIRVCEKLGYEYLWIDSLCIIQDNPKDWEVEAGTMHLVYKHAEATIVAAAATSSHKGFLERNISLIPAVKVEYSLDKDGQNNSQMILHSYGLDVDQAASYESDIDYTLWNSRGWALQERYLSTRLIYFCKSMLYFECRSCCLSEANCTFTSLGLWSRADLPPSKLFKMWQNVLQTYSSRQLTYASDKLLAVQSFANDICSRVPGRYIAFAGMWEENILQELLWFCQNSIPTRPADYRAPSWSWASLDGAFGYASSVSTQRQWGAKLDVIQFGEVYPNPSYAVRNYIEVRGSKRAITFVTEIDRQDYWLMAESGSYPYNLFTHPSTNNIVHKPVIFAYGKLDMDNRDNLLGKEKTLLYLHVDNDQQPSGLILIPAPMVSPLSDKQVWARIGVATVFAKLSNKTILAQEPGKEEETEQFIIV